MTTKDLIDLSKLTNGRISDRTVFIDFVASCEGARGAWGCSPVEQFSQLPPAVLRITTLSKIAWLSAYGVLQ